MAVIFARDVCTMYYTRVAKKYGTCSLGKMSDLIYSIQSLIKHTTLCMLKIKLMSISYVNNHIYIFLFTTFCAYLLSVPIILEPTTNTIVQVHNYYDQKFNANTDSLYFSSAMFLFTLTSMDHTTPK